MNLMIFCPFPSFVQLKFSKRVRVTVAKRNIEVEEEVIQEISNIVFKKKKKSSTCYHIGKRYIIDRL